MGTRRAYFAMTTKDSGVWVDRFKNAYTAIVGQVVLRREA